VFLVSAITEKAQATIDATAFTPSCCFSDVRAHFYAGSFLLVQVHQAIRLDQLKTNSDG